jgi:hypothetical protein
MTTYNHADASKQSEEAPELQPTQPAPWMPLGPLTELWAAFGKEAMSREALLAASSAFAALADEREAIHTLNWLAPVWPHSFAHKSAATPLASFSLLVTHEAIIDALSRAATHWYEAARALVEYVGQPPSSERDEQGDSPALDLETLIGYTLSQRLRVWAIAHSLLAEQMQQLFPAPEQQGGTSQ